MEDPHIDGLRGQSHEWAGRDTEWYALIQDEDLGLHINVRVTVPLQQESPHRKLVTGVSVLFGEHSFVVEANDPYSAGGSGCPLGVIPCLADGALTFAVDNEQPAALHGFFDGARFHNGIVLSATNVPAECGQFGVGGGIWATAHEGTLRGQKAFDRKTFEEWVLISRDTSLDWCAKYITERGLADVQSTHALLRIETPVVTVRVGVGPDYRGGGKDRKDDRPLWGLDLWQMDVGLEGLLVGDTLSGVLGETDWPSADSNGQVIMSGPDAPRFFGPDYRVSGPRGVDFALQYIENATR